MILLTLWSSQLVMELDSVESRGDRTVVGLRVSGREDLFFHRRLEKLESLESPLTHGDILNNPPTTISPLHLQHLYLLFYN
jgi:hypothetical protein